VLAGDTIELGPGQLAVVGFGKYANARYDLGIQDDVVIPRSITPSATPFSATGKNTIQASVDAPQNGDLRIVMQQRYVNDGTIARSWKGGPPNGANMGQVFVLSASQAGKPVPVEINYDKVIWSGLSWAVGEIKNSALKPGSPVTIQCSSSEGDEMKLEGKIFVVTY
jgi:hypothetical protein